jgi:hypothetical protein
MTKSQKNENAGDRKAPALRATESGLRMAADQAGKIVADSSGPFRETAVLTKVAAALKSADTQGVTPVSCKQVLWLSFFFDGTGNNLDADISLFKHSNVARLYRAHKPENKIGDMLVVYIPGVGTYFPEIGDDGGSSLGLGCGKGGDQRLEFALQRFDKFLARPLALAHAPASSIKEINIAVFGFSRGAALARAFVNMVMEKRCSLRDGEWKLKTGDWPVRFRFLGLFDTVASVGLPMSSNTTGVYEAYKSDTAGMIAKRLKKYEATRPQALAFAAHGRPGADPAPGKDHGHDEWGGRLRVHETVEEVRHFVAGHEIRNSFPLDSISILATGKISKPAHFYETVYPGAHSDVGGGYTPGDGAKGLISAEKISLIPLRHMYDCALRQGVPLITEWTPENKADFDADPTMCAIYNGYMKTVGTFASVGNGFNKHMALYYAWRFRMIARKVAGDKNEAKLIEAQDKNFRKHSAGLAKEVADLETKDTMAKIMWTGLIEVQEMEASSVEGNLASKVLSANDAAVQRAQERYEIAHDTMLRAKARKDFFPNMNDFQKMLDLYDKQLLDDVRWIRATLSENRMGMRRGDLRPHYKVLLEAFENEFERKNGLKDESIISFFDNYIHNSLVGFAKDATLPSDPRVVYLGGNEKYRYASIEDQNLFSETSTRMA